MRYCKRCVQPDTRKNIIFDSEGICGGCRYQEYKDKTEWDLREKELLDIVEWAKQNTTCSYDCVIGVSGGKDSHFQAIYAKEKLGLNPLLVCNAPDGRTTVGTHNIENLRSYGFDLIEIRPNPEVMRMLTKRDFILYGNLVKSSEYSLWASAYRVAVEKQIPLVIQGENPALIFGLSDGVHGGNALSIRHNNTINGCNASDLVITTEQAGLFGWTPIDRKQLDMFQFPDDEELECIRTYYKNTFSNSSYRAVNTSIKGVFLQYYVKQWGQNHNTRFARNHGLLGRYTESLYDIGRTFRETSVDGDLLLVNQWLKYLKFGFGYETDAQCYNIRELGETRENAIKYVKMYDHCIGEQYIDAFCEYIGMTKDRFYSKALQFTNPDLFTYGFKGDERPIIIPKFEVGKDLING